MLSAWTGFVPIAMLATLMSMMSADWVSAAAKNSAVPYQLSLRDGSVFTAELSNATIRWTDVLANGEMRQRNVPFAQIERLYLSDSPASQQVAQIRQYLNMLQGGDYRERELSEERLSDPNIGGRFVQLIKAETENPSLEVRFRVERILERLDDNKNQTIAEFDILEMKDGSKVEGDAGDFEIDCSYRGQLVTLPRSALRLIASPPENVRPASPQGRIEVEVLQRHEDHFYQPGQTVLDFETAPSGSELSRNTDVSDAFLQKGLLLSSEKTGFVGISGYGFNFPKAPLPRKNSICVFETVGRSFPIRFKGVMEMRFCMPNQRSVTAGVHELGFFIARVAHSRDFILEAYNSDGHLLANVEASDQDCVFMGVKSSEPISFVRVLSNPYLFRLKRTVDEDFAIDQLCFSSPVPVFGDRQLEPGVTILRNGDLLKSDSFRWNADELSLRVSAVEKELAIPIDEIEVIRFENEPVKPTVAERKWRVMLDDRSVLNVIPGKRFASTLFEDLVFPIDEISAIWFAANRTRYPTADDFIKSQYVMVFPTCRLVSNNVNFVPQGYVWRTAEKLEQDLIIDAGGDMGEAGEEELEDPGPSISSVDYIESSPEDIPTIWTKPPRSRATNTGMVRLVDGQQFVLEGQNGFSLVDLNGEMLTLSSRGGQRHSIPLDRILTIQFPTPTNQQD